MQCPFCRGMESSVVDSRLAAGGTTVWRRRACDACQRRFTTYERVEHSLPIVVKKDGQREPFDRNKILRSLRIACNKRPISADTLEETATALEREIGEGGEKEIASVVIGERVMARLKQLEVVALKAAGKKARGATLYATLEPCNHVGKTPPCVDAIVAAGIARVVIGRRDPNPRVTGGGVERLEKEGIEVKLGVMNAECKDLIRPWAHFITTGRSYL